MTSSVKFDEWKEKEEFKREFNRSIVMNIKDVEKALQWRYAVKKFDSNKKIAEEDWKVLEQSLWLSPSSYGLQPWKFLIIHNPELREKLRAASWNQSQVTDCSHYVVFIVKNKIDDAYIHEYLDRISEVQGVPRENLNKLHQVIASDLVHGPRAQMIEHWGERQSYIAMGFLMETAALLQIDACPLEGIDPKAYDNLLSLTETGYHTIACVALGYRASDDKYQFSKKVRFPIERIIEYRN